MFPINYSLFLNSSPYKGFKIILFPDFEKVALGSFGIVLHVQNVLFYV